MQKNQLAITETTSVQCVKMLQNMQQCSSFCMCKKAHFENCIQAWKTINIVSTQTRRQQSKLFKISYFWHFCSLGLKQTELPHYQWQASEYSLTPHPTQYRSFRRQITSGNFNAKYGPGQAAGNSTDKCRQPISNAYQAEQVLLNRFTRFTSAINVNDMTSMA